MTIVAPKNAPLPADVLLACLTPKMIGRFWKKVQLCEHGYPCADCCWLWIAGTSGGYGSLMCRYLGKPQGFRAHRISWTLRHGAIPDGLHVLHNCPTGDNPTCVNPAHLWLGGNKANQEDSKRKGRIATGDRHGTRLHPESFRRGETHPRARLTASQVLDIRYLAAQGMAHRRLARIYGVPRTAIRQIVRGKNWAHLPLIVEVR